MEVEADMVVMVEMDLMVEEAEVVDMAVMAEMEVQVEAAVAEVVDMVEEQMVENGLEEAEDIFQ